MSQETIHPVSDAWAKKAWCNAAQYEAMYKRSIENPDGFWGEQAERLDWIKRWDRVKNTSFERDISIKWYEGGQLNVSVNCLDRHLATRGDQPAIIWEGDDPNQSKIITYREAYEEVCRFANVLKAQGVKRGDRVTIYMPMIPETAFAMLAGLRQA